MEVFTLAMSPTLKVIIYIVAAIVVFIIAFVLGITYRKKVSEREIQSAEEQAKKIIKRSHQSCREQEERSPC